MFWRLLAHCDLVRKTDKTRVTWPTDKAAKTLGNINWQLCQRLDSIFKSFVLPDIDNMMNRLKVGLRVLVL
jgi:hypothetical protein